MPLMPDEDKTFSGYSGGFENLMTSLAQTLEYRSDDVTKYFLKLWDI